MSLAIAFSREKRLLQFYEVPSNSFQQREEVTAILRCPQQQLSVERRGYCNSTRSLAIAFSREKRLLQFYDVPSNSNSFQQREEVTAILRCPQQQLSVERRGYCNSTMSLAIAFSREKRLLQFYEVPSNSFQQREEFTAILRGPQQQLSVERRGYCNSTRSLVASREKRFLQFYDVPSNSFQQREEVTAILRCPQQQLSAERRGYCNSTRSLAIAFSREKRLLQFYDVPSNSFQQRKEVTAILRGPQQQLSVERRGYCNSTRSLAIAFSREKRLLQFYDVPSNSFQQREEVTAILRGPQQQLSVERRGYCNSTRSLAIAFSREKRLLQFYDVPSNSFQQREEVTAILRCPQQQLSVERRGYCNSTMSLAIAFSREKRLLQFYEVPSNSFQQREEVTAILRCPQRQQLLLSVERRGYCNSTRSLSNSFQQREEVLQFYDVPSNSFQQREEVTAILRCPQQQLSVERRGYCNSTMSLAIAFSREKRLLQFYEVPSNSFQQREEVTAILRCPQQQLSVERRGYCNSTMSLAIAFSREKRLLQFYDVPSNSFQQREEVTAITAILRILRCPQQQLDNQQREEVTAILRGPQQQLSVERRGYCNSTRSLAIAFSREKRLLQFYDVPSNSFQQRGGYCNSTMSLAIAFSREKRLLQFYEVPDNSFQQREEVTAILRCPQQQLSVERRGYCNSTRSLAIAFSRGKRLLQFYEFPSNSFQQREEVTAILRCPQQQLSVERRGYCNSTRSLAIAFSREKRLLQFYEVPSNSFQQREEVTAILRCPLAIAFSREKRLLQFYESLIEQREEVTAILRGPQQQLSVERRGYCNSTMSLAIAFSREKRLLQFYEVPSNSIQQREEVTAILRCPQQQLSVERRGYCNSTMSLAIAFSREKRLLQFYEVPSNSFQQREEVTAILRGPQQQLSVERRGYCNSTRSLAIAFSRGKRLLQFYDVPSNSFQQREEVTAILREQQLSGEKRLLQFYEVPSNSFQQREEVTAILRGPQQQLSVERRGYCNSTMSPAYERERLLQFYDVPSNSFQQREEVTAILRGPQQQLSVERRGYCNSTMSLAIAFSREKRLLQFYEVPSNSFQQREEVTAILRCPQQQLSVERRGYCNSTRSLAIAFSREKRLLQFYDVPSNSFQQREEVTAILRCPQQQLSVERRGYCNSTMSLAIAFSREKRLLQFYDVPSNSFQQRKEVTAILRGPQQQLSVERRGYCNSTMSLAIAFSREKRLLQFYEVPSNSIQQREEVTAILRCPQQQLSVERRGYCNSTMSLAIAFSREKRLLQFYEVPSNSFQQREEVTAILRCPQQQLSVEKRGYCNSTRSLAIAFSREKRLLQFYQVPSNSFQQIEEVTAILRCPQQQLSVERRGYCNSTMSLAIAFSREKRLLQFYDVPSNSFQQREEVTAILRGPQQQLSVERRGYCNSTRSLAIAFSREKRLLQFYDVPSNSFQQREEVTAILRGPQQQLSVERRGYCNSTMSLAIAFSREEVTAILRCPQQQLSVERRGYCNSTRSLTISFSREKRLLQFYDVPSNSFQQREEVTAILRCPQQQLSVERRGYCNSTRSLAIAFSREKRLLQFYDVPSNSFQQREEVTAILRGPQQQLSVERRGYCNSTRSLAIAFSREKRLLQFYDVPSNSFQQREEVTAILRGPQQQLSVERRGYCNSTMSLAIAFSREKRLLQFYEVPSNSFQQREEVTAILRGPQQQLSVERRGYCNSTMSLAIAFSREKRLLQFYDVPSNSFQQREEVTAILRCPQQQLSVERRGYCNSTRSLAIAFSREKRLLQFYDVPSNSFQQREEVTAILRGPQQQLSVERRGYCNSTRSLSNSFQQREEVTAILRCPQQQLSVERRGYCNSTRSLAIAFSREKRLLQFYDVPSNSFQQRKEVTAILRGPQQQLSVERRGYCNSTRSLAIAFSREKRLLQFYDVPSNSFQQREEVTAILRGPQQQLSVERRGYCNSTRSLAIAFSREKRLLQFYDVPSNSFQQREEVTAILRGPQQQLSVERRGYCNSTMSLAIAFSREKRLLQFYDVPSNSFQQREEVTAILRGPQQYCFSVAIERGYCNSTMSLAIAFSREKRLLQFYDVPSNSFQQREEVTAILRGPQQQLSVERRGYCNSTMSLAIAFSREKRLLQFYEVPSNSFQQREEVTAILRCPQQQLSVERGYCNSTMSLAIAFSREKRLLQFYDVPSNSFQQREEVTAILRGPQQQLSVERRGYCNSTSPQQQLSVERRLLQFYDVPSNSFQQREEVTAILRGPQQQLSVERRGYCNSTMSLAIAFSREKRLLQFYEVPSNSFQQREEVTAILRCPQQQLSVERRGYCNSTMSLAIAFSREKRLLQFYEVPSNSFQQREEVTAILRCPQQQLSVERRGYCNSTRSLAIAFSREKRLLQFYDVPSNSFQQREEVTAILRCPQQQLSVERRGYCNSTRSLAIAFSREKRLLQFYDVPSNSFQQREEVTAILRCPQQQLSVERRGYCNSTRSLAIAFSREKRLLQFYDVPSNSFQQREEVTAILRGPQQQLSVERRGYCNSTMSLAIAFSREKRLLQFYDVPSNSFQQREEVTAILRGPQQQLSVERRGYCNSTMSLAIAFSREKRLLQFYEVPSNSFQQREEVTAILRCPQQQLSVERRGYCNSTMSLAIAFSREKRLLQFYEVPSNSFQQREEVTAILRCPQQQLSVERRGYCNSTMSLAIVSREEVTAILRCPQQQLSVERRGYCNSTRSLAIAFSREKRLLQFYDVPSNSFQQREEVTAILRGPQQQLSVERRGYCNSTRSLAIAFSREKRLLQFYDVPSNSFQQREEVTAILRGPQQQLSVERRGYCNSTMSLAIAFSREKRLLQFYEVPSNSFQQREEVTAILRGPQQQLSVERRGYCNSTMSLAIAFSREKRLLQFYDVPSNSFQQREEVTAILRVPSNSFQQREEVTAILRGPQQQLSVERRGYCNSTMIAFSREKRLLQFYEVPSNSFQQREEVTAILRGPQQQLSVERRGYCNSTRSLAIAFSREKRLLQFYDVPSNSFQQREEVTAILRCPQQQLSVERRGYCNSTRSLAIAFSREKRLLQFYDVPSNSFQQREEVTAILRGPQQQLSVERRGYCNSTMSLAIAFSREKRLLQFYDVPSNSFQQREEVTAILRCPQQQLSVERRGYCNSTRSLAIAFSREKRLLQFYDVPSNSFQQREEVTAILRCPQQQLSVERRGYCNSTRSRAIAFSREKRLLQFYDVPSNSFQQREEVTAILRGPQQQLSVERRGYCNSTRSLAIAFSREKRLLQFYDVPSNSFQQREEVTAILRCPQQQLSVERRGYCNSTRSLAIAFSREKRLLQFYDVPSNSFQQREEVTAILRCPQQQLSVERRGYCNSTRSLAIAFSREKRLLQFYDVPSNSFQVPREREKLLQFYEVPSNSFQQREEVTAILRCPQQQLSVERRGYCNSTRSLAIAFSREKRLLQFYDVPSNPVERRGYCNSTMSLAIASREKRLLQFYDVPSNSFQQRGGYCNSTRSLAIAFSREKRLLQFYEVPSNSFQQREEVTAILRCPQQQLSVERRGYCNSTRSLAIAFSREKRLLQFYDVPSNSFQQREEVTAILRCPQQQLSVERRGYCNSTRSLAIAFSREKRLLQFYDVPSNSFQQREEVTAILRCPQQQLSVERRGYCNSTSNSQQREEVTASTMSLAIAFSREKRLLQFYDVPSNSFQQREEVTAILRGPQQQLSVERRGYCNSTMSLAIAFSREKRLLQFYEVPSNSFQQREEVTAILRCPQQQLSVERRGYCNSTRSLAIAFSREKRLLQFYDVPSNSFQQREEVTAILRCPQQQLSVERRGYCNSTRSLAIAFSREKRLLQFYDVPSNSFQQREEVTAILRCPQQQLSVERRLLQFYDVLSNSFQQREEVTAILRGP